MPWATKTTPDRDRTLVGGLGPGAALADEPGAVLCLAGNAAIAVVANDAAFRTWMSNAATGPVYPTGPPTHLK